MILTGDVLCRKDTIGIRCVCTDKNDGLPRKIYSLILIGDVICRKVTIRILHVCRDKNDGLPRKILYSLILTGDVFRRKDTIGTQCSSCHEWSAHH